MKEEEKLHVIVVSPERTLFDGLVDSVTFPGEDGSFAVLRDHAPLISSLVQGQLKYRQGETEKTIDIAGGFVEVNANRVSACVETHD